MLAVGLQTPLVSFKTKVEPMRRLMPMLAQAYHEKLSVDGTTADDVVALGFEDQPLDQVKSVLAKTLNATWVERRGQWTLTRTAANEKVDAEAEVSRRESMLREYFKKIPVDAPFGEAEAKSLAIRRADFKEKTSIFQADTTLWDQLPSLNEASPVGRLSRRLVEALGYRFFAQLPQDAHFILAAKPNKLQKAMPKDKIEPALAAFRQEQNLYEAEARKHPPSKEFGVFTGGFDFVSPVPEGELKVLLDIKTESSYQTLVKLEFVNPNATVAFSTTFGITVFDAFKPKIPKVDSEASFEYPAALATLGTAYAHNTAMDSAALALFRNPLDLDPVTVANQPGFECWHAATGRPTAAYLGDSLCLPWDGKAKLPLSKFVAWAASNSSISDEGGWTILRPLEPARLRQLRVPRRPLQKMVESVRETDCLTIDAFADVAAQSRSIRESQLMFYTTLCTGERLNFGTLNIFKIYALASQQQRRSLRSGESLSIRDMTPAQRDLAVAVILNPEGYNRDATGESAWPRGAEVSELFPNGLPDTVQYSLSSESVDAALCDSGEALPADYLANRFVYRRGQGYEKKKYRMGRQTTVRFSLFGEPNQSKYEELDETNPASQKWVGWQDLPPAFVAEVTKARALIQKFVDENGSQKGVPPPR